jgi:hypothetical protein
MLIQLLDGYTLWSWVVLPTYRSFGDWDSVYHRNVGNTAHLHMLQCFKFRITSVNCRETVPLPPKCIYTCIRYVPGHSIPLLWDRSCAHAVPAWSLAVMSVGFLALDSHPVSACFGATRCYVASGLLFFSSWAANRPVRSTSPVRCFITFHYAARSASDVRG